MSKAWIASLLIIGFVGTVGCQPPPKNPDTRKIGRLGRGAINWVNGQPQSMQAGTGVQWGQITSQNGDQAFQQALSFLTAPTLQGQPDLQLGYVSSQPNQQTGVYFWGQVFSAGGMIDSSRSRIHIEIWDSKAGQMGPDGNVIPPVVIHIGSDQTGFVSVQGSVQGGAVQLVFTDETGSIYLNGNTMGQYLSGTIQFSNANGSGPIDLGQFNVPACGFLSCNQGVF